MNAMLISKVILVFLFALPMLVGCNNDQAGNGDKLLYLVLEGDISKVKELVNEGVDINYQNSPLRTGALHACLSYEIENIDMLALLIQKGADVNIQNSEGSTPLKFAVVNNYIASIKILLKEGADVGIKDRNGSTVLDLLDIEKDAAIIKLLMNNTNLK